MNALFNQTMTDQREGETIDGISNMCSKLSLNGRQAVLYEKTASTWSDPLIDHQNRRATQGTWKIRQRESNKGPLPIDHDSAKLSTKRNGKNPEVHAESARAYVN